MDITLTFLGFGLGVCEQKVLKGSTLKYSVPVTRWHKPGKLPVTLGSLSGN
jgi:hypothetical protein